MKKAILLFAASLLLFSCVRNYKIPAEDYSLVPYTGKEILIFNSSKGKSDTIFLQGKNLFNSWVDQWSIFPKNAEYSTILAKRSDPSPSDGKQRYLDSSEFITLFNDGETKLKINFTAKDAWFYDDSVYNEKALSRDQDTAIKIDGLLYTDVIVFKPNKTVKENINGIITNRSNTIYKLYWSKRNGIIRYDKKNEFWELVQQIK